MRVPCVGSFRCAPRTGAVPTLGVCRPSPHDQNRRASGPGPHGQIWSSTRGRRRGYVAPVSVWAPPLPARWSDPARPPFVGRRTELTTLEEVWTAAAAGLRQGVFLRGGTGGGKAPPLAPGCPAPPGAAAPRPPRPGCP